jgi:C1A family cysteine protease
VTDPKQALTKLREPVVLAARRTPSGIDAALDDLAANHSITTVEEVVALAMVDGNLFDRLPGDAAALLPVVEQYRSSPEGAREIESWSRYVDRDYATGCRLDLTAPPAGEPTPTLTAAPTAASTAAPTAMSLIDEHLSPIRDQAQRGTCTAFAALACLEYHEHRFAGRARTDLSEQFAYWNMVEHRPHHDLVSMFMGLRNDGACAEHTWPYVPTERPGDDGQGPPPAAAPAEAVEHRAPTVLQLPARDVDGIQRTIAGARPVAIGIPVYASWFASGVVRKYGNITVPLPGEDPEPIGHAVALVGYADDPQFAGGGYFVVRNSWDGEWGTESVFGPGYGTIPYRYVERCNWDAWCVSPAA